jgi:hypothetical protein
MRFELYDGDRKLIVSVPLIIEPGETLTVKITEDDFKEGSRNESSG